VRKRTKRGEKREKREKKEDRRKKERRKLTLFLKSSAPPAAACKLYTYPSNPRAYKAMIASLYSKVPLQLMPFEFGVTNKQEGFLEKFPFGKVPVLETPDGRTIAESNAISFYIAAAGTDQSLVGTNPADAAEIQMFINLADNEIAPAAATWIFPILGFIPFSHENTEKAKQDLKKSLAALNKIVSSRTFLVGHSATLADIHIVISLLHLYMLVLDEDFRSPFPHLNRYFLTMVHQPQFKAVLGEVSLASKMAVYDPKNLPR